MKNKDQDAPLMDFAEFVEAHAKGDTNRQLSERLQEVITAVKSTQKGGEMTIKISLKPEAHLVKVDMTAKLSLPQPAIAGDLYHFHGDTSLSKEDPKQLKIELRSIDGNKPTEMREPGKKPE